ncbi:hypothetical protein D1817_03240 [Flavobacteriaceae bacterium]|nr:hypothetical protein D1817_03240 [Flavobacteriaceae bacterium]
MKNLKKLGKTLNKQEQLHINGGLGPAGISSGGVCEHECSNNSGCPAENPQCVTFNLNISCPDSPLVRSCI